MILGYNDFITFEIKNKKIFITYKILKSFESINSNPNLKFEFKKNMSSKNMNRKIFKFELT